MDRLQIKRRASQAGFFLFFLLMPVFDILRYDVASKELYLLGQLWSLGLRDGFLLDQSLGGSTHVALQFLLKAVLPWLTVLAIFPLLGLLLGRFFCGWLCPEGTLFEYADWLTQKLLGRRTIFGGNGVQTAQAEGTQRVMYGVLALTSLLVIPPVVGIFLTGYFIDPSRIWHEVATLSPSFGLKAGVVGVSAYMIITSTVVRHLLCKYVCAAGLMQMLFGWLAPRSLRVRFDTLNFSKCTDCRKCEQVCFMGVKPRSPKKDINCVNCGECITACQRELGTENGLFSFGYGSLDVQGARTDKESESRTPPCSGCPNPHDV